MLTRVSGKAVVRPAETGSVSGSGAAASLFEAAVFEPWV